MLQVRSLAVHYGDTVAVDDATFDVGGDETLVLLGRSGSGKTSLLKAIAGFVRTASGRVLLDEADITELPPHRRGIGFVFQDYALFPHLDVAANIGYGLRIAGVDPSPAVERSIEMVGLGGLEGRRIDQLSGGQAQRVALARTLATEPRLLLLDEPLGSLDPAYRSRLAVELDDLLTRLAIPTILVTHATEEAFALGHRLLVLDRGRIAARGRPDELWRDPGTVEVARMLGHTGIVSADVAADVMKIGPVTTALPGHGTAGKRTVLVRPDAVSLDPTGASVPVVRSRFRGPNWVATVDLAGGTVEVPTPGFVQTGARIEIAIDPAGVVALD